MSTRDELRARLMRLAQRLGPLADDVVLVGGCVPSVYELLPVVSDVRPTDDMDLLVEVSTRPQYYAMVERFKRVGATERIEAGAPICRHDIDDMVIDIMPTKSAILGFTNRWYADAFKTADRGAADAGIPFRVIQPIYFLATKLDALLDRGRHDFMASEDLEDIVNVLIGVPGLTWQVRTGVEEVNVVVRETLKTLFAAEGFLEACEGHAGPHEATRIAWAAVLRELVMAVEPRKGPPFRVLVRPQAGGLEFSVPRQSLAWTSGSGGALDEARYQFVLDEMARSDVDAARREAFQAWAPSPLHERLDYLSVSAVACDCLGCVRLGDDGLPCWTCASCLSEADSTCGGCKLALRAFPDHERWRQNARSGYLRTDSERCRIHDHRNCPRRWEFNDSRSKRFHSVACDCPCHHESPTEA